MYPAPVRHPSAGVSDMQTVKTHSHTLNLNTHPSTTSHTPTPSNLPPIHVKIKNYNHFNSTLQMFISNMPLSLFFLSSIFFSLSFCRTRNSLASPFVQFGSEFFCRTNLYRVHHHRVL